MTLVDTPPPSPLHRAAWAAQDPLLTGYYDEEWGMPVTDETGVFERLTLEAFQSGLSWLTVLRKREGFRAAFDGFDPARIARYDASDVARLLADPEIIRNRLKVQATITNAQATLRLADEGGPTLPELVWSYMPERSPAPLTDADVPATSPESHALARDLKRRGFRFVGPTTVYALMTALGIADVHLVGSHRRGCSGLWNRDGSRTEMPAPFSA
ncbi:DNA-3-methyladenine glycosylase I [Leucobacter chromiireducens]|uniref:DNA-3-methyladenine glycosylase I n=1 Tax=Leucobacter chromiireducens subsp. solipictus TaxID=398235 RepID=A0ABS1SBQ1_9MICO|nr:DNA-3-methyladenine glycosylase I [Leucobacter chromiireducens]MBL3677966.1 DNA-3-methyladenine glycosylase I [Leucobacter chromiireducens subsp. solipictus]